MTAAAPVTATEGTLDWRRACVEHLAESGRTADLGGVLISALLVFSIWGAVPRTPLLAWFALQCGLYALRMVQIRNWHRRLTAGDDFAPGARQFMLATVAGALGWAACWSFLPLIDDPERRQLIGIVVCAVTAGGVIKLGIFKTAAQSLLTIVILPLVPAYWIAASSISIDITIAALLYWVIMMRLAGQLNSTVARMIRQRFENDALIAQLSTAKQRSDAANAELTGRIRSHEDTERALTAARDQAEQAARAKAEFLANMSHEIRTPMNGVLGMTELLLGTALSRKQRHFAATIHRSGESLLGIINDILDFSKIEAGKLEINAVVFDLRTLVEDIGTLFAQRAEQAGLGFTCAFDAEAHATYRGDPDRIQQVLTNLVGNALKFTREGNVSVRAFVTSTEPLTNLIRFEVRDTGVGIAPEHQAKIFDSFVQADGSTTRKFGGTGLGLAICRQLTQMMGGEIGLESASGKGSTFWFTVRLQPEASGPQQVAARQRVTFKGRRILVADENAANRELLDIQLRAWRAETVSATSRDQAMKVLRESAAAGRPIDCVVLDHAFARDGLAFVAALRRSPPCELPRFVMLAGVTALQETGQWLEAGIDAYVSKPIRQNELQHALAKCLIDTTSEMPGSVPLDATGTLDRTATIAATEEPALPQFRARVLVAEDNPVNQELAGGMLEGFGCRFEMASNGAEAVSAIVEHELDLRHDPFKLVLMDCQMPELDGFEATRRLREYELESGRPRLPIIAITANALSGDRELCLEAGMDDYLTKPFTRAQLQAILERWLPLESTVTRMALSRPGAETPSRHTPQAGTLLDLEALRRIRALQRPGTPDILAKVVTLYEEAAPRLLNAMLKAVEGADSDGLKRAAHSLKSSSASLGATACAELCRELETLGGAADFAAAGPKVDVLAFELDSARAALRYQVTLNRPDAA